MPFSQRYLCCSLLLSLTVIGCASPTATGVADVRPAVLVGNGTCHDAIEAAMKAMAGSNRIRLSPEVFRTDPVVLLSNYIPSELLRERPYQFSEAADKRFLLHMQQGRCLLSLVDADDRLIATQELGTCRCAPCP